jgi:hypothetical protein
MTNTLMLAALAAVFGALALAWRARARAWRRWLAAADTLAERELAHARHEPHVFPGRRRRGGA